VLFDRAERRARQLPDRRVRRVRERELPGLAARAAHGDVVVERAYGAHLFHAGGAPGASLDLDHLPLRARREPPLVEQLDADLDIALPEKYRVVLRLGLLLPARRRRGRHFRFSDCHLVRFHSARRERPRASAGVMVRHGPSPVFHRIAFPFHEIAFIPSQRT